MHVTITEISADGSVVRFTHDAGTSDGIWRGDAPVTPGEVTVELVLPGRFWWDDDLRVVVPRRRVVDLDAGTHPVTGTAVAYDDRGVLTLRVGDGQVLVQTGGNAPRELIGQTVEVDSPLIELHPV